MMNFLHSAIGQIVALVVVVLVGGWLAYMVARKIIHIVIFIVALLIVIFIYKNVPMVHSLVSSVIK